MAIPNQIYNPRQGQQGMASFFNAAQQNPDADWGAIAASQQPAAQSGVNSFYEAAQNNPDADWGAIAASQQPAAQSGVNKFYKAAQDNPDADWGAIAASQQPPINKFYEAAQDNPDANWGRIAKRGKQLQTRAARKAARKARPRPGERYLANAPEAPGPEPAAQNGANQFYKAAQENPDADWGAIYASQQPPAPQAAASNGGDAASQTIYQAPGSGPGTSAAVPSGLNPTMPAPNGTSAAVPPGMNPSMPAPGFGGFPGGGGTIGADWGAVPTMMPPNYPGGFGGFPGYGGFPGFGGGYPGFGYGPMQPNPWGGNPWGNQMSNLLGQMGQYRAPGQGQVL